MRAAMKVRMKANRARRASQARVDNTGGVGSAFTGASLPAREGL